LRPVRRQLAEAETGPQYRSSHSLADLRVTPSDLNGRTLLPHVGCLGALIHGEPLIGGLACLACLAGGDGQGVGLVRAVRLWSAHAADPRGAD